MVIVHSYVTNYQRVSFSWKDMENGVHISLSGKHERVSERVRIPVPILDGINSKERYSGKNKTLGRLMGLHNIPMTRIRATLSCTKVPIQLVDLVTIRNNLGNDIVVNMCMIIMKATHVATMILVKTISYQVDQQVAQS